MCIQEMKWTGRSVREIGDGYKVLYSGGSSKKNGVDLILDSELNSTVIDIIRHNDRLMLVKVGIREEVVNVGPNLRMCSADRLHTGGEGGFHSGHGGT